MNKYLIALIVVVLLGGGYYWYTQQGAKTAAQAPDTAGQPGGSQEKLDINAVCEGALAYMTFPDSNAANTFVVECKAGEHPEVIEQYKKDHQLDGAAI